MIRPAPKEADAGQHALDDAARRIGMQDLAEQARGRRRAEPDQPEGPEARALALERPLPADSDARHETGHQSQHQFEFAHDTARSALYPVDDSTASHTTGGYEAAGIINREKVRSNNKDQNSGYTHITEI